MEILVSNKKFAEFVKVLSRYSFFLGINLSERFCDELEERFGSNPSMKEFSEYFETFYQKFQNEIFSETIKKTGLKETISKNERVRK